jgi:hypothetical protein
MSTERTPTAKAFLDRLHGELVSELYRDEPIAAAERQMPPSSRQAGLEAAAASDGGPPPARSSRGGWGRVRRRRVLLPSLATLVVAALVAAAAIAASTVTGTPPASAQARVAAAVTRITQEGYRVRARVSASKEGWQVSVSDGVFDPANGAVRMVVVTPDKGHVTIHVGDVVYVQIVGRQPGMPPSARWFVRGTRHPKESDVSKLADFGKVALQNPQQALGWARSAGDVRELGSVAGDGWSGRRYAFTLTERFWRVAGTVDVDAAGRVHRLEFTSRAWDTAHGIAGTMHGLLEFRDFGTRERVTIPPADQVFQIKIPEPRKLTRR